MNAIPLRSLTTCGRTRREFLWQAGGGFVGTALTYLLAQDSFFPKALAAVPDQAPLAPRQPHFSANAKSCIFLFMYGGPSQVDLWDPKPELAKHHGKPIPISIKIRSSKSATPAHFWPPAISSPGLEIRALKSPNCIRTWPA